MTAYADVSGAQVASAVLNDVNDQMDARGVPMGGIIMWSGLIADIPAGYKLCNGGSGAKETTPDLSSKFIMGSDGTSVLPGDTGGTNSKTLDITEIPAHTHTVTDQYGLLQSGFGGDRAWSSPLSYTTNTRTTSTVGGSQAFDNRPAFYVLAFIKRED